MFLLPINFKYASSGRSTAREISYPFYIKICLFHLLIIIYNTPSTNKNKIPILTTTRSKRKMTLLSSLFTTLNSINPQF